LEDASQETFIIVHRKLATFRGDSSLKTWICGICVRVAAARRRRAHRKYEIEVPDLSPVPAEGDLESEVDLRRARNLLERILTGLDESKRQVFVLFEMEELPVAEIAAVLNCPLRTAYSRLEAARREVIQAWKRELLTCRRDP
jgi:RNA polymerase sigma-70 factor, ECF subfamily